MGRALGCLDNKEEEEFVDDGPLSELRGEEEGAAVEVDTVESVLACEALVRVLFLGVHRWRSAFQVLPEMCSCVKRAIAAVMRCDF